jgi:5-methylcytosine-specific restriction endonuclease McrA
VEVEASFSFRFEADGEFMKLYEETRALMGGAPTMAVVFSRALKMYSRVKSPIERAKRREQRKIRAQKPKPAAPKTRHIPASVRDQVFNRDKGQCSYIAPDGHRCTETHGLQLDHIEPYSIGGKHSEDNLRLLCAAHNRLFAERVFGRATIESYVGRG